MGKLNGKFMRHMVRNWDCHNTYNPGYRDVGNFSCVYVFVAICFLTGKSEIAYVGSTSDLKSRYKSHKIPEKIHKTNDISILYFKKMDKNFYEYEKKLINKLKPCYNIQHKGVIT